MRHNPWLVHGFVSPSLFQPLGVGSQPLPPQRTLLELKHTRTCTHTYTRHESSYVQIRRRILSIPLV